MTRRSRWLTIAAIAFALYVSSYVVLSRRGYDEARRFRMVGFYYFTPEDTDAWRWRNYGCAYLFMPLNLADCWLGFGREPASEPLWGLGR